MIGAYQRIAVTHHRKAIEMPPKIASGCHMKPAGMPAMVSFSEPPAAITNCATIAPATATSGIRTAATANLDSTLSTSDSGSDFQNSTERSRRSEYSESSA